MLVLFETAAGYAVFKLLDEKKLRKAENLYLDFESPEAASKVVKLTHFKKFQDTTEALAAATANVEGKMSKSLKKVMKHITKDAHEELALADVKLGSTIKDKYNINCVSNSSIHELLRGIRSQMDSLITGLPQKEVAAMALGLAHSLSRYKLKFSPDKVDTMIVQAISLLDDLDKELNNYIMRVREWYGWHFPELGKIITDNMVYAKLVKLIGDRTKVATTDFSELLPEEVEKEVKDAAEISMGTEISEEDIINIKYLCEQVIDITDYRVQLYDYVKNRMMAVAPNLTILVGELVGARLIAHAGSLLNLAKQPSSTVQILGAEKALFRALKTKHDTPKFGLIYHASLVGQSSVKSKGKISRALAAKAALAIRVDALGEETSTELGLKHRARLELRMRELEEKSARKISGTGKAKAKWEKYENKSEVKTYNVAADSTLSHAPVKRKFEEGDWEEGVTDKKPKLEPVTSGGDADTEKKKKKKKVKEEPTEDDIPGDVDTQKKKKKKAKEPTSEEEMPEVSSSGKKMKKKKKIKSAD